MEFNNAQEAFEYYYDKILDEGIMYDGCLTLFNQGFLIKNPLDRDIKTPWRKFKKDYAEYEWEWYLKGNPNAHDIAQRAKIWYNMMDEDGNVNSNYGYQWNRNNQLEKVIEILKKGENRKASISLYDGKEIDIYTKDTVCTYAVAFTRINNLLNMSVLLRSNDLFWGYGVDTYCFSKLQELVANRIGLEVGTYFHFAVNLHLYPRHFETKQKYLESL